MSPTREQIEELLGKPIPDWQWEIMDRVINEGPMSLDFVSRRFDGKQTALNKTMEIYRVLGYRVEKSEHGWKVYEK